MAHSLSAKKRIRQNETRSVRNQMRMSRLRTEIKKFAKLMQHRDAAAAREQLSRVYKVLDQVAAKGTIHANMASRKKGRLTRALMALEKHAGAAA